MVFIELNFREQKISIYLNKENAFIQTMVENTPFPNHLWPLFQSDFFCLSFHMNISFRWHVNEN